jgi:hypothetical protein
MATRKTAAKKTAVKTTKSMPKAGKNPKGGLTAAGRAYFKRTEGSNLKPGVTGAADTPEKMRRKGSFLRRHFAHPRGPMQDENGQPTRLALSAHAWGEPVPKDDAAARRLAAKGQKLLEQYHATQVKSASTKAAGKKAAAGKATPKKAGKKAAKKSAAEVAK